MKNKLKPIFRIDSIFCSKPVRNFKQFIRYLKQYKTHYHILSISKKKQLVEDDKWYQLSAYIRFSKDESVNIANLILAEVLKEEENE